MTEKTTSLLILLFATVALLAAWAAADVLFLFFGGVLFAVFLRGITNYLSSKTKISDGWALAITLISMIAIVMAISWFMVPLLSQQTSQLTKELPNAWNKLVQRISQYDLGQTAVDQAQALTDS